ncbi:uncharacterized protein LOC142224087 [Haematobia irritans]|uniref:uncharacterized protein LOC142224087 n=1 Tax=Haematobia irritans TaxID=7368 RepID=UPI003F4FABFD
MQHVWFLLKFCEFLLGLLCLSFHIMGLDEVEPLPHVIFYCGTFLAFILISMFGAIGILLGRPANALMEAIINGTAALMYIISSALAMYHAELDFHLMYLSDFEEPLHRFFKNCKRQSIASLANGFVYLLHSLFALDICLVTQRHVAIYEDENEEAIQPMRMYFISETIQKYLERYPWFRWYVTMTEVSGRNSTKSSNSPNQPEKSMIPLDNLKHETSSSVQSASIEPAISENEFIENPKEGESSLSMTSLPSSQLWEKSENV